MVSTGTTPLYPTSKCLLLVHKLLKNNLKNLNENLKQRKQGTEIVIWVGFTFTIKPTF